jgi:sec-independent protein translocase protein TatC
VLLTLMGKAGLVNAAGLRSVRKYAIVGILTLAAVATPPDVTTQLILFTVVYGLYEVSIFLVARVETKREAELRAEGLWFEEEEEEEEDAETDASEDPYNEGEEGDDPLLAEFDADEDEGESDKS